MIGSWQFPPQFIKFKIDYLGLLSFHCEFSVESLPHNLTIAIIEIDYNIYSSFSSLSAFYMKSDPSIFI